MLKIKVFLVMLAFLLAAAAILYGAAMLAEWASVQPGGPVVDRRERAGLILVADETPERWGR